MLSLIEQIKQGTLWDFPGGIHPAENKTQSNQNPIVSASVPTEIVLPLKQHIGKAGDLIVAIGDKVLKGQPLTRYNTSFMLPIHASTSGTITAIEPRTTAHPSGLKELSIVIKPDGEDTWCERTICEDYTQLSGDELIEQIRLAGISGMGGAGFPTAKKIQSGLARTEILIINAAECEPYITADDRLMQEHAQEIITGIEIVEHILKPKLTIIGIEDNKPEAIKALQHAAKDKELVIRVIPTKYPSGGEKQLIKILTNKEVPNDGIPADIGILVQNVGSLYAIKRAICDGEPVIDRVVTLTGNTFSKPKNVWARIGTSVEALLNEFGYKADRKLERLIMGGPMMGFTLPHGNVPITKTSNCILAPTRKEISSSRYEMNVFVVVNVQTPAPASLLPQQLQLYAKAEDYDKCEELNLKDCIECGACAYVCPSEIPLVHYYRQAKAEIRTRKDEALAAERAKQRFEEKNARMERDKAERENRFKKAADNRRKTMKESSGATTLLLQRSLALKLKKKKPKNQPSSQLLLRPLPKQKRNSKLRLSLAVLSQTTAKWRNYAKSVKRQARERKAKQEQTQSNKSAEANDSGSADKKSAVAAAIARAKAKKAEQSHDTNTQNASGEPSTDSPVDNKKAAIAAAITRAKAKKSQQEKIMLNC